MEDAVSSLEREFKRINIDLEYSSRRLESEFKARGGEFADVVSLVKRINCIRSQIDIIREKVGIYDEKKQTIVQKAVQQQLDTYHTLTAMLTQYGLSPSSAEEVDDDCCNDWEDIAQHLISTTKKFRSSNSVDRSERTAAEDFTLDAENKIVRPSKTQHFSAVQERRMPLSEMMEVDPTDFNKIPSHIRGRCSVADANNLFKRLQEDYKKIVFQATQSGKEQLKKTSQGPSSIRNKSHSAHIPPPKVPLHILEASGYKVCGQTGKCVLGSLQKMGLVDWSRDHKRNSDGEAISLSSTVCKELMQGAHSM